MRFYPIFSHIREISSRISSYLLSVIPDCSNEQKEFFYDENGNLIYDSDRKICSIRYNLLNLPDIIQFKNGDQIVHVYDAEGTRRQTKQLS